VSSVARSVGRSAAEGFHSRTLKSCHPAGSFSVDGHAYCFTYDVTREVLYRTTPEPSRVAYHHRAADLMSDRPEAMAALHHLLSE